MGSEAEKERTYTAAEWEELIRDGTGIPKTRQNPLGAGRTPAWIKQYQEFLKFQAWKEVGSPQGADYGDILERVVRGFTGKSTGDHYKEFGDTPKGFIQKMMDRIGFTIKKTDWEALSVLLTNPLAVKIITPALALGFWWLGETVNIVPIKDDEGNPTGEKKPLLPPFLHMIMQLLIGAWGWMIDSDFYKNMGDKKVQWYEYLLGPLYVWWEMSDW